MIAVGDEAESTYLEVKSSLDMKSKTATVKIAKFLLGVANRRPQESARYFQGYAVLVIGAQKGGAPGVPRGTEAHELEDSVRPYLGPQFPAFEFGRIGVNSDREVLFVIAQPPQEDQTIFPCHRTTREVTAVTVLRMERSTYGESVTRGLHAPKRFLLSSNVPVEATASSRLTYRWNWLVRFIVFAASKSSWSIRWISRKRSFSRSLKLIGATSSLPYHSGYRQMSLAVRDHYPQRIGRRLWIRGDTRMLNILRRVVSTSWALDYLGQESLWSAVTDLSPSHT